MKMPSPFPLLQRNAPATLVLLLGLSLSAAAQEQKPAPAPAAKQKQSAAQPAQLQTPVSQIQPGARTLPNIREDDDFIREREAWFYSDRTLPNGSVGAGAYAQEKRDRDQSAPQKPPRVRENLWPETEEGAVERGAREIGEREGADFLRRRAEWFFHQRAYPLGFIPQGSRERALEHMRQMYAREGRLALPSPGVFVIPPSGPNSAWTAIGPQATRSQFFPPFTSGRVTALVVNPNNSNNVYLGGADGGLWVSTDSGVTWTSLTDNPPSAGQIPTIAVGALALEPTTCGLGPNGICTTIFVGTGEDNFAGDNVYGEGVLKCAITAGTPLTAACTQDNTFRAPSPLDQTRGGPLVGALAVNRAAGKNNILLAGVRGRSVVIQSGIYCSQDSGLTWTKVLPDVPLVVGTDVAFASDGTAYAALGSPGGDAMNNGIYKSKKAVGMCSDIAGSTNWTKQTLPAGTPASSLGRIALAIAPSSNDTIYAAIANSTTFSNNLLGVVKTTNATSATPTWTQLTDPLVTTQGFCNAQCFYDFTMAVHPTNPNVVFAGGAARSTIIRTTNGGMNWAEVSRAGGARPHVDTHAFAFSSDGSRLFVGNDGGVWSTSTPDTTISWTNLNSTLNITQFYPGVSIHPSTPLFAMGGTQDNGTQVYTGNPMWQDAGIPCDGGFTAINTAVPSTSYGMCEYIPGFLLIIGISFRNGDLGNGFLATAGIDGRDRGGFIPPLIIDTKNSQTLYFGTCRIWQTTSGAAFWNAISPDVTEPGHAPSCPIPTGPGQPFGSLSTIAVAPSDSRTIYTGSDGGEVEVTPDGGATWTSITTSTLPTRAITQVTVDPTNNATAYVTFSGFGSCNNPPIVCDMKGHVFKTTNGTVGAATTWTEISGSGVNKLPDIPVNAIVVDPDDTAHNTLYVGTDIGVFFTTDGGANWSPLGAAGTLPSSQVLFLTLHQPSRTLRAATHGRGMWDINLGPAAGTPNFRISAIAPFSANAGDPGFALDVQGSGFTSISKVLWNGAERTTTFKSASDLNAAVPASDLTSGAAVQVRVQDGANMTSPVVFTVLNPVPGITSISPTSVTAGTTNFTLTVNGSSFICGPNGTIVLVNLSPRTNITSCNSDTSRLTVLLPDSDLATGGSLAIDTFTPPPGGGPDPNPNPPVLTVNNPVPSITTLSPSNAMSGGPAFTLTVNGTGFVSTSTVRWNGSNRNTTFVNAVRLTAAITANDIMSAGNANVTVVNPAPGGGISGLIVFVITQVNNPVPTVTSISPTSKEAGAAVTLTVNGTGFVNGGTPATSSQVRFGSRAEPTTFVSSTQLTATIPASDTATGGPQQVTVTNPPPGGGTSTSSATFTVRDYAVSGPTGAPPTINAGQLAMFTITVSPQSGSFGQPVMLTASGLPAASSASFSPNTVTPGESSANSTLTITTTARSAMGSGAPFDRPAPPPPVLYWLAAAMLALLSFALLRQAVRRRRYAAYLPLALLVLSLAWVVGCGGGGGGGTTPPQGTPPGPYTIMVTATSGTATRTTTVMLTVN